MTRVTLATSLAVLSIAAGGLTTLASAADPPVGPLTTQSDTSAMVDLETKINSHLRSWGALASTRFSAKEKLPGQEVASGGYGDSGGLWTGVYLGGEALRYATARHYLTRINPGNSGGHGNSDSAPGHAKRDGLTDDERAFWTAQRDEALSRARSMVAAFHVNVNIAAAWKTTTKVPTVNYDPTKQPDPTQYRHLADFGGGIINGEPGMLMRSCSPLGDPFGVNGGVVPTNDDHRLIGPLTWTDGSKWLCEGSPSRDTYAGVTFGLLTAYDLIDDEQLRTTVRNDIRSMGEFLFNHGWNYVRPWGYVSVKHDFDNVVSPLFVYVPMARLNLTNAVRHVLDEGQDPVAKAKWDGVWAEEFASQATSGSLLASMEIDSAQPNDGYYKFNLHHLTTFNLLRTTTGVERDVIARAVAVMDKTTHDDLNAHFEAITYAVTGEQNRLSDAVKHLREWLQYRAKIDQGVEVKNSPRCGPTFTCVKQDQYGIDANGQDVAWFPGTAGLRAERPMPVADRAPSDFIWQRPPTQLDGGQSAYEREPGVDFLTPYWMLRYFTEVSRPALSPLPEWAGPAHL